MGKKTKKLLFFLLLCVFSCDAKDASKLPKPVAIELENLENLIEVTEKNLNDLVKLKSAIVDYQELQQQFLEHPHNRSMLIKSGKAAQAILETIHEMHLLHTFDAKFLSELSLLTKMIKKPTLPLH